MRESLPFFRASTLTQRILLSNSSRSKFSLKAKSIFTEVDNRFYFAIVYNSSGSLESAIIPNHPLQNCPVTAHSYGFALCYTAMRSLPLPPPLCSSVLLSILFCRGWVGYFDRLQLSRGVSPDEGLPTEKQSFTLFFSYVTLSTPSLDILGPQRYMHTHAEIHTGTPISPLPRDDNSRI